MYEGMWYVRKRNSIRLTNWIGLSRGGNWKHNQSPTSNWKKIETNILIKEALTGYNLNIGDLTVLHFPLHVIAGKGTLIFSITMENRYTRPIVLKEVTII